MKPNIKTSIASPQICEPRKKYGKLKVEQYAESPIRCDRAQPLYPASPVLAEALRGHDGIDVHPKTSGDGKRTPEIQARMENASMKDTFDNAPDLGRLLGLAVDGAPIELRPGTLVYDKRDLDTWIDSLKTGTELASQDAIVGRL